MKSIREWLPRRSPATRSRRRRALRAVAVVVAVLACASSALAFTIPYSFTPVTGSPFKLPITLNMHEVLFSPDGAHLASLAVGGDPIVQNVSKIGAVGADTFAVGGPAECAAPKGGPIGGRAVSLAYSPTGSLLALALENSFPETGGSLRIYSTTGSLYPSDSCRSLPTASPERTEVAYATAFSPNGLLAVTDASNDTVSVFSVTSAGKAIPVSGSPFFTGKEPVAVTFGPTRSGGEVLVVANAGGNSVSTFTVSGGTVAPAAGGAFPAGSVPSSVAMSPGGLLAVADSATNDVSMFSMGFTGTPTAVAGSPVALGGSPNSVAFDPTGTLLAAGDGNGDVPFFEVSSAGTLTPVSSTPLKPGAGAVSVDFSPDGFLVATASEGTYSWSVYSYGEALAVVPPWLESRLAMALDAAGLGLEKARIMPLIGHALEQVNWGSAHPTATVHLISKTSLPGREVGGACVAPIQAPQAPHCWRTLSAPLLTFVAHDLVKGVRILVTHTIKPGTHTLWVTAAGPHVTSTPEALRVVVVG